MLGNIMFRDCVDKLLNECYMKAFTDQKVKVKVCYNSCSDDGCNNKPIASSGRSSTTFSGSVTAVRTLIGSTALVYVLAYMS